MGKSHATPKSNLDQTELKETWNRGHPPVTFRPITNAKEEVQVRPRGSAYSSVVFVDDLGTTLNEY